MLCRNNALSSLPSQSQQPARQRERQFQESWKPGLERIHMISLSIFFCVHTSTSFLSDCFNDSYIREPDRCHWAKSGAMECYLSQLGCVRNVLVQSAYRNLHCGPCFAVFLPSSMEFGFLSSHHFLGVEKKREVRFKRAKSEVVW